jgi:hypothetical protein
MNFHKVNLFGLFFQSKGNFNPYYIGFASFLSHISFFKNLVDFYEILFPFEFKHKVALN